MGCIEMVKVVFLCCLLLLMRVTGLATSMTLVAMQTDVSLSLSIEQEVEESIARGQRWLKGQGVTSIAGIDDDVYKTLIFSSQSMVEVSPAAWASFTSAVEKVDARAKSRYDAITKALNEGTLETLSCMPSELYAYVQCDLFPKCVHAKFPKEAPIQWRTQLALYLVTSQQMDAKGGFWQAGSREESFWAVLLLRLLIYRQPALLPVVEGVNGLEE